MNDPKGMEKVAMFKCEGCGEYHPQEECEIVMIKMIKGKNCKIGQIKNIEAEYKRNFAPPASNENKQFVETPTPTGPTLPGGVSAERDTIVPRPMPSNLKSMFVPADTPGADVVTRKG